MNKLNLVIDVDGVLTTGQFLYSESGKSYKVFGAHDADGLKMLKDLVIISFITADKRGLAITEKRLQDMGFSATLVPEADRFTYVRDTFGFANTIYIGDGLHDAPLLKQALFGIAPANARAEAIAAADFVTPSKSAEGAVLDACLHIKNQLLNTTNLTQHIDQTDRYTYQRIRQGFGKHLPEFNQSTQLHTLYLHQGQATIEIKSGSALKTISLSAGQGFYATPPTKWRLIANQDCDAFYVASDVNPKKPILQIIDNGNEQQEQPLAAYGVIENPKKVDKPWGHELWIMWSKDYHVLKQIKMNAGNQSSLQIHRQKLETNYLVEGQADVIDQLPLDTTQSEEVMTEAIKAINLNDYKETKNPGMHWTSSPGIVHRVIAATDYIAYETSTPELDDVIRLQDDSNRQSGRIVSEHKAHAV